MVLGDAFLLVQAEETALGFFGGSDLVNGEYFFFVSLILCFSFLFIFFLNEMILFPHFRGVPMDRPGPGLG